MGENRKHPRARWTHPVTDATLALVAQSGTNLNQHRRIGRAWREIRRGAAASRIKDLFYGDTGADDGLDLAIADALSVLAQQGSMRMGEMAEALRITPASATRAVTCLADKGYAERVKATDDQRSILVTATPAGLDRYASMSARVAAGLDEILSEFDDDEKEQLAHLLERFTESVDRYVNNNDTTR